MLSDVEIGFFLIDVEKDITVNCLIGIINSDIL